MRDEYYHLRGWDEQGRLTSAHLKALGLVEEEAIFVG